MYRSFLFVPANEKKLNNINKIKSDAYIIDLEDSIKEVDKDTALKEVITFLENNRCAEKNIFVRINSNRCQTEIPVLNPYPIEGYMIPKTEDINQLQAIHKMTPQKKLIALLETAKGIVSIPDIVSCKCIDWIAFGAEDYSAQTGIKPETKYLSYVKSKIVTWSKAYGIPVIDTISLNISDMDAYKQEVEDTKAFGFDGKLAIHPKQLPVIHDTYCEDISLLKKIVREFEQSSAAVVCIDNKIYEKPHIEAMRKKIKDWGKDNVR